MNVSMCNACKLFNKDLNYCAFSVYIGDMCPNFTPNWEDDMNIPNPSGQRTVSRMTNDDKEATVIDLFNNFINFARAIYESQYGEGIGTDGEATVIAEIDRARKIHISITMEDLT